MPEQAPEAPVLMPQVAAPGGPRPLATRNVLLLQGLMGPLFRKVGAALRRDGYGVYKVNFNGGDRLFWRLPNGIDYRGTPQQWPAALRRIIAEHAITDLVLFGDCRPLHIAATAVCRELHIPVHVFEEGYIRPDWITLELGGVNGHSTLPRDPAWYHAEAATLPPVPTHAPFPSSFRRRAAQGILYNLADVLTRWHYPHWENHRPFHPVVEGIGWARRLMRRKQARERAADILARLATTTEPYMVFPLQLDSDAQIRFHSSFAGVADALLMVITSFASHAPKTMRLVIKEHPLDNGVRDWRNEAMMLAALHGVAERVDYLETGDIVPVTQRAKGMVTINSTSGTIAVALDVPVIALGQAVYDIEGITFQGRLDDFWREPGKPDPATFAAFRRVLIDRCLVPGGFFSDEALDKVIEGVVARLEAASPLAIATGRKPAVSGAPAAAFAGNTRGALPLK